MRRIFTMVAVATLLVGVGAIAGGFGNAAKGTPKAVIASAPLLTLEQLSAIQPGLGTVMVEYNTRFNNLWFAAQKGNWRMVRYQIKEMREIQEVAETTRPKRAPMLKAFESGYLDPLDEARKSNKLSNFKAAYNKTIAGCNGCHAASDSPEDKSFEYIKVTRPKRPAFSNVDWAGQKK